MKAYAPWETVRGYASYRRREERISAHRFEGRDSISPFEHPPHANPVSGPENREAFMRFQSRIRDIMRDQFLQPGAYHFIAEKITGPNTAPVHLQIGLEGIKDTLGRIQ